MKYRKLGSTGFEISAVAYGGVVSAAHFDEAVIPGDGQAFSDHYVSWAVDRGINYFDVAPSYGDAELLMGNSLKPYRKNVFLACKVGPRTRKEAEPLMRKSLELLHTDYFDVYQMHGLCSEEEVDIAFGPGGVMELMREMKEKGITRKIGITAHSEKAALKALSMYDFDTVLFPTNWHMNMAYGLGSELAHVIGNKGIGFLGMKSMIDRSWEAEERYSSKYPKSWCRPIDTEEEPEALLAAMRYALSLGVDTIIPPGNFDHFRFAVEHIDDAIASPISAGERDMLEKRLELMKDRPFLDIE